MNLKTVILKKAEGIATLTFNRPERMNAMDDQMWADTMAALDDVAVDNDVRVVVLKGAGKAFCSGADLKGGSAGVRIGNAKEPIEDLRQFILKIAQGPVRRLQNMDKPTVAMVNGAAVGAGFDIALACDIRLGSENTRFLAGYTALGLANGTGGPWLLPRIVGLAKAMEFYFVNKDIKAKEAHEAGLLNMLVPAADLEKETLETARRIAEGPPLGFRLNKRLLRQSFDISLEEALQAAAANESMTFYTGDYEEGIAAFLEKRPPTFQGK